MKDIQKLKDNRGIKISEVGITNLRVPDNRRYENGG